MSVTWGKDEYPFHDTDRRLIEMMRHEREADRADRWFTGWLVFLILCLGVLIVGFLKGWIKL